MQEGFGLQLIRALVTKLKAEIEIKQINGTQVILTIPINKN